MRAFEQLRQWDRTGYPQLAARLIVGLLFVYLGVLKALDPVAFMKAVREYQFFGEGTMLNWLAAILPWIEIFCGILLIAGIGKKGNALLFLGMLLLFSIAIAWRASEIHDATGIRFCGIRFDCGCGTGEVRVCPKLTQNLGLFALNALILVSGSNRFSLKPELFPRRKK